MQSVANLQGSAVHANAVDGGALRPDDAFMPKITEEQRAELLASNASRDVVEAVLARLDAAEGMLVTAMEPRAYDLVDEDWGDETCPFCEGPSHADDGERTYDHAPQLRVGRMGNGAL
jgi:hypothetical protein